MHTFHIDLYLRHEMSDIWLFVPPYPASMPWPIKFNQGEILSCQAGFIFRIDEFLWLGNEMDPLPLEMVCSELANTLKDEDGFAGRKLLASFPRSEFTTVRVEQSANGDIILSRDSTRDRFTDYYEWVAGFVGTYYRDFAVERQLWRKAVNATLDGLALVFGASPPVDIPQDQIGLARWLVDRYNNLAVHEG